MTGTRKPRSVCGESEVDVSVAQDLAASWSTEEFRSGKRVSPATQMHASRASSLMGRSGNAARSRSLPSPVRSGCLRPGPESAVLPTASLSRFNLPARPTAHAVVDLVHRLERRPKLIRSDRGCLRDWFTARESTEFIVTAIGEDCASVWRAVEYTRTLVPARPADFRAYELRPLLRRPVRPRRAGRATFVLLGCAVLCRRSQSVGQGIRSVLVRAAEGRAWGRLTCRSRS